MSGAGGRPARWAAEGGDVALVAHDKAVIEVAQEAVSTASGRRVIAVS